MPVLQHKNLLASSCRWWTGTGRALWSMHDTWLVTWPMTREYRMWYERQNRRRRSDAILLSEAASLCSQCLADIDFAWKQYHWSACLCGRSRLIMPHSCAESHLPRHCTSVHSHAYKSYESVTLFCNSIGRLIRFWWIDKWRTCLKFSTRWHVCMHKFDILKTFLL